jgi:hypothetical protein
MAMVGVVVGHQNRIDVAALGGKQLLAKVRTAVDQQDLLAALDEG